MRKRAERIVAATEVSEIDGEGEKLMRHSGGGVSSLYGALNGSGIDDADTDRMRLQIGEFMAWRDAVADEPSTSLACGAYRPKVGDVDRKAAAQAIAWNARFRALAEAAYHGAVGMIEKNGPGVMVIDGTAVSRQGREKPSVFRRQHGDVRPIDRYRERGSISERQYEAGDKLWCDLMRAGLAPRVTANLLGTGGGGEATFGMAATEGQAIARQRIRIVTDALGRRLWAILQAVIWDEMSASAWAEGSGIKGMSTARVAGLTALRIALDELADHYRLQHCD